MAITFVRKDWTDQIITKTGRTVSYKAATKTTDNISGDETITLGNAANYNAIFVRRQTKWLFDKDGLVEGGDAYMITSATVLAPTKNSTVTVDSRDYRVQDVVCRYGDDNNSTALYYYCNLFLIS